MTRKSAASRGQLAILSLDDMVPAGHLVRKLEAGIEYGLHFLLIRYLISPFQTHLILKWILEK